MEAIESEVVNFSQKSFRERTLEAVLILEQRINSLCPQSSSEIAYAPLRLYKKEAENLIQAQKKSQSNQ
jgi:hypothetical protein